MININLKRIIAAAVAIAAVGLLSSSPIVAVAEDIGISGPPQVSGASPLTAAHIWVGNGSGIATDSQMTGSCTLSNIAVIDCSPFLGVAHTWTQPQTVTIPFSEVAATFSSGASSTPSLANTVAPFTSTLAGINSHPSVAATNTQNWSAGIGLAGVESNISTTAGATGTISAAADYDAVIGNAGSTSITTAYGFWLRSATSAGTTTNLVGLGINGLIVGTNNIYLLLGTNTPPTGNFGIYEATSNDNYMPGHLRTGNSPPSSGTPTSCGTGSPTVIGSDTDGLITTGTAATACTITFATAYASAPFCVVTSQTQLVAFAYTISNSTLSTSMTSVSGGKINYHCVAQSGG